MRQLTSQTAAALAADATTLCHCWRLARRDGVVLGFTDHDRDCVKTSDPALRDVRTGRSGTAAGVLVSVRRLEARLGRLHVAGSPLIRFFLPMMFITRVRL